MVLDVPAADMITATITELRNLMPKETLRDVLAMMVGKEPIAAPKLGTRAPELIATTTEILTLP